MKSLRDSAFDAIKKSNQRGFVWFFYWLLIWCNPCLAATVDMPLSGSVTQIGRQWDMLEDKSGALNLADVQKLNSEWSRVPRGDPNFGFSRSSFWLRATLINTQTARRDWLLGLRHPALDYIDVYFVRADGHVREHHTGDRMPFNSRSIKSNHFYFDFELPPNEVLKVFVRLRSLNSIQAPLTITNLESVQDFAVVEHGLIGAFTGALLVMFAYSAFLYLTLREPVYLYYASYLTFYCLSQLIFTGIAFEQVWPNSPDWNNQLAYFSVAIASAALMQFGRIFLSLKSVWPPVDAATVALIVAFLGAGLASFLLDYGIASQLCLLLVVISSPLGFAVVFVLLLRGNKNAVFFTPAFAFLSVGSILAVTQAYDLIAKSFWTTYAVQISLFLEVAFLSYALAHRIKKAQQASAQLQIAHTNELEERVRARTAELDKALNELTAANQQLQALNVRDPLTGLHNRLHLSQSLPGLWRQAQRWQHPLSVLMVDVDHFKLVNDRYGHAAGDQALRKVAQTLAHSICRPGDVVVRYGGEEFLVVLPNTDEEGGMVVAEKMRKRVEGLECVVDNQRIALTVSVGVASISPGPADHSNELLQKADKSLYAAKLAGRNRCLPFSIISAANCA